LDSEYEYENDNKMIKDEDLQTADTKHLAVRYDWIIGMDYLLL